MLGRLIIWDAPRVEVDGLKIEEQLSQYGTRSNMAII